MDRPIIFSAPMIRAIRREIAAPGTGKTQTRRILTRLAGFGAVTEFGPSDTRGYDWHFRDRRKLWNDLRDAEMRKCLPYAVGDRLWVRESLALREDCGIQWATYAADGAWVKSGIVRVDPRKIGCKARPSIHMPRWASRLTLLVTDVRVERLTDISREDAIAEGCIVVRDACNVFEGTGYHKAGLCHSSPVTAFGILWDDIHGPDAWDANPWVVAVSFQPFETNIDRMPERQAAPVPAAAE